MKRSRLLTFQTSLNESMNILSRVHNEHNMKSTISKKIYLKTDNMKNKKKQNSTIQ